MLQWGRKLIGRETPEDVIANNNAQIAELESQQDEQTVMVAQLTQNATRLAAAKNMAAARQALAQKKDMETTLTQTTGKIAMLRVQNNGLKGLDSNVKMHESVKRSNAVTARVGKTMNVDEVHDTMDTASQHKYDHLEISEALAGANFLDPVDEDDADAELASLVAAQQETQQQQTAADADVIRAQAAQLLKEAEMMEALNNLPPAPGGGGGGGGGATRVPQPLQKAKVTANNNALYYHSGNQK